MTKSILVFLWVTLQVVFNLPHVIELSSSSLLVPSLKKKQKNKMDLQELQNGIGELKVWKYLRCSRLLQIWNEVSPILWLLRPGEYHLSPRNVLHKQKQKTKELGHVWFIKVTTKHFNAYTHTKRIYHTQMHILAPMKNRSLKHARWYSQSKINYL